jgi:hypothetical protein
MSPLLRRPCGHSILHLYADNYEVLNSVHKAFYFTKEKTTKELALPLDVLNLIVLVMSNNSIGRH